MDSQDFFEKIKEAELILVGLGEAFDGTGLLGQDPEYRTGCGILKEEGLSWLLPGWNEYCLRQRGDEHIEKALERLDALLEGKNYFGVSVSTNSSIAGRKRMVMACGSTIRKQCAEGCEEALQIMSEEDRAALESFYCGLAEGKRSGNPYLPGRCPKCGGKLVLNNVYAENYNEKGYLDQWGLYMKWLQGTLNRRLLVLELGVGMQFPSVIRWPFEKAAFFNRKAFFCRVNDKLYQMTKELAEKGCGISEDAVDWLARL